MTLGSILHRFRPSISSEDISLLTAHALKRDRVFIYAHPEYILSPSEKRRLLRLLERRKKKEPVAYIIGEKEFFGRPFFINRATLIPRPETEQLVERVLADCRLQSTLKNIFFADIGTGSGNIIISIASELEKQNTKFVIRNSSFDFLGTDISSKALAVAKKNARRHALEPIVLFRKSDLLKTIPGKFFKNEHWIITANLPYLSGMLYRSTDRDVRMFEPKQALFAKKNGTDIILSLLRALKEKIDRFHPTSFFLILEISPEQSRFLKKQAGAILRSKTSILRDLSGKHRFIIIESSSS